MANRVHERYAMLDGWRGVAALAVVFHHVSHVPVGGPAVMCFFVISGYCITASAEAALRNGMSFGSYMRRRINRIYPPYLASLLFYISTRIIKLVTTGINDLNRPVIDFIQSATLTQWLTLVFSPATNPIDNPSLFVTAHWSLCYEEQFYLLMGLPLFIATYVQRKNGARDMFRLVWICVALSVVFNLFIDHLSYGLFLEYFAMFGVGCLVYYRLSRLKGNPMRWSIDLFLAMGWIVAMMVTLGSERDWEATRYDDLMFASGFGLLLIALHRFENWYRSSRASFILGSIGLISYSLYLVHQFNLNIVLAFTDRILPAETPYFVLIGSQIVVHVIVAAAFWFFFERPYLNHGSWVFGKRAVFVLSRSKE
jgi:peptidoglycan/LPS O-acetylase OafA/YrhL